MLIIFKNVPKRTNPFLIINKINPHLQSGFLKKETGVLHYLQLVEITNFSDSLSEYHFLALITPDSVATRIISKLNGVRINNLQLEVAEYMIRSRKNCRRLAPESSVQSLRQINENRIFDRRVKNQLIIISSEIS